MLSPTLNEDWCENIETTSGVDGLMDMCEGFCGGKNIPFLVGLPTYGFALKDIDEICLREDTKSEFLSYDPTLMANCKKWSQSLGLIQMKAADFVAALDNMTYAQLVFRQGMQEQVEKIVEAIGSEQTKELMMNVATDAELLPTYMALVQAHLHEFLSDGKLKSGLQSAMGVLADAGSALQSTLVAHLPSVEQYFDKCRNILLATGTANEYMMNLCNQRTPNCLAPDDVDAKHVGCCCGAVPLTGSFGLSGESASRRLAKEAGIVDICGEASNLIKTDKGKHEKALQQTDYGKQLLSVYKAGLKQKYPEYTARYESKCVGGEGRRLQSAVVPEAPISSSVEAPAEDARRLQSAKLVGCEPRISEMGVHNENLRVAFWNDTETDYCDAISDTNGLAKTCKAFCGESSVPLMLGSTAFGFNQTAMESACGQSGDPIKTDSATVAQCHDHAKALNIVKVKASAFIAKLAILDAEKLRFEASITATVKTMREDIKAKADGVIQDAEVGKKIDAFRELLEQETAPLTGSSAGAGAKFFLEQATAAVQTSGDELTDSLTAALAGLQALVNNCNHMFTGVGPHQEYLLDLCSQTSKQCIESPTGRHAGCCCGYLPLLSLGLQSIPTATIAGLSVTAALGDESSRARVAAQRRLAGDFGDAYHVCAESWLQAKAPISEAEAAIKELGAEYIITDAMNAKAAKYPEYFGGCLGECQVETGGTCKLFGCDTSRGGVDCKDHRCVCKAGYCMDQEGKCVARGCQVDTGGTCKLFNCGSSRGEVDCKDHRCVCKAGYCIDQEGKCSNHVASADPAMSLSLLGIAISAASSLALLSS